MAKRNRNLNVDVLGEVRRAMRILRRVEQSIIQRERVEKRQGEKRKAAFERMQQQAAQLGDFGEQG